MPKLKFAKLFLPIALITIALNVTMLQACPGCNALDSVKLAQAFNPSVLFMMAMPFTVVGAIAGGLAYTYWRAQKQANQHEENELRVSKPA